MACESCNRPWHTQAVSGAVGLAKNVLGIEQVSDDVWAARLNACRSCAHLQRFQAALPPSADLGLLDRCQLCGCPVKEKAKLAGEECPAGLWGSDA